MSSSVFWYGTACCRGIVWRVTVCCAVLGHVVVVAYGCVRLLLVVVLTLCVVVCGCGALWRVVFCVGSRWVPRVAPTFALLCCAMCRCVHVLGCVSRGVRFCVSRWGCFGVGFRLVALCVLACVAFWCAVLSRYVLVCGVGRWCVESGTVVRCCVLLFVGWLRCITRCVAHRCFAVGCGVVFRVVGFIVVCCDSALRGVVVLSCWLRYVAPLWCHVAPLGDVVWRGLSQFSHVFVVACSLWCFVVPRCVVEIGVVWCLGMCFVSVHGVVALLCGVVRWCEPCMCVRDTQRHVLLPCVGSRRVVPLVLRHVRRVLHSVMPFTSVGSPGRAIPLGMLAMDMGSRGCTGS